MHASLYGVTLLKLYRSIYRAHGWLAHNRVSHARGFTADFSVRLFTQSVATCGDTDSTAEGAQPYACDASKGLVPKPDASMAGPPNDTVCCLVSSVMWSARIALSNAQELLYIIGRLAW
jgi:hypothetical protein